MNIPDKAVEAAARAGYERLEDCDWSELPYEERKAWTEDYGHALAVAAPSIAAQALRDAAKRIHPAQFGPDSSPYLPAIREQIIEAAEELDPS